MKTVQIWLLGLLLLNMSACEEILEEEDISFTTIQLLAPLEGSFLEENQVNLNWESARGVTAYQIQLATPAFSNANQVLLDSIIVQDTMGVLLPNLNRITLANGNYQWRVRGLNSGFVTPYSSATFTISGSDAIDTTPPNIPTLVLPAMGALGAEGTVSFSWTREDSFGSAERDSIFIFTDEALQSLTVKGLGANKTFTVSLEANTYYWVVQAFDAAGNSSAPSSTFTFTLN